MLRRRRDEFRVFQGVPQRGDVLRRRAAAAAENSHTGIEHRLHERREFLRRAVVHGLAADGNGHAGVGLCDQRYAGVFPQAAQLHEHLLRPGRAVEPESVDAHALQHGQRGGHIRAREAPAALVAREGHKDRFVAHAAHGQHGGACIRERHHRLDDIQIDAGRLEPGRLFGINIDQILERRLAERSKKQASWRKIARDPRPAVRRFARERGKAAVIICRLVEDAAFLELLPVGTEGRRVEHLASGGNVAALDADNDVRVFERPLLGAHIAGVAVLLQFGAGRAVEDEGETDFHVVTSVKCYGCGNDRLPVKAAAKSARPDSSR